MKRRSNDLLPLGYATPAADAESRLKRLPVSPFAAIVGSIVGLLGALTLLLAANGVVSLVRNWRGADGRDVLVVAVYTVVGALSLTLAIRWIRSTTIPPLD